MAEVYNRNEENRWRAPYEERKVEATVLSPKQLCQKLKTYYEIDVPAEFEKALTASENKKCLSTGDLEQVMKIASFWKQCFVEKEKSYNKLVLGMVRSMVRIHCTVINTNPQTNAWIGKYGEIDYNSKPFREAFVVTTSLTLHGQAAFVQSPGCYRFT